jgi:hypothetical protein
MELCQRFSIVTVISVLVLASVQADLDHSGFQGRGLLEFFQSGIETKAEISPQTQQDETTTVPIPMYQGINGVYLLGVPINCPQGQKPDTNSKCRNIFRN